MSSARRPPHCRTCGQRKLGHPRTCPLKFGDGGPTPSVTSRKRPVGSSSYSGVTSRLDVSSLIPGCVPARSVNPSVMRESSDDEEGKDDTPTISGPISPSPLSVRSAGMNAVISNTPGIDHIFNQGGVGKAREQKDTLTMSSAFLLRSSSSNLHVDPSVSGLDNKDTMVTGFSDDSNFRKVTSERLHEQAHTPTNPTRSSAKSLSHVDGGVGNSKDEDTQERESSNDLEHLIRHMGKPLVAIYSVDIPKVTEVYQAVIASGAYANVVQRPSSAAASSRTDVRWLVVGDDPVLVKQVAGVQQCEVLTDHGERIVDLEPQQRAEEEPDRMADQTDYARQVVDSGQGTLMPGTIAESELEGPRTTTFLQLTLAGFIGGMAAVFGLTII